MSIIGHPEQTIRVAVAAVVEKVSSIDQLAPAEIDADALKAIEPQQLRVLITLRPCDTVLGGLWELPGGKLHAGESHEDAVKRELLEEVGIHVTPLQAMATVEHQYAHGRVCLTPYLCCRTRGMPRPIEVAQVRWVGVDELDDYRLPEATLPMIASLRAALS